MVAVRIIRAEDLPARVDAGETVLIESTRVPMPHAGVLTGIRFEPDIMRVPIPGSDCRRFDRSTCPIRVRFPSACCDNTCTTG